MLTVEKKIPHALQTLMHRLETGGEGGFGGRGARAGGLGLVGQAALGLGCSCWRAWHWWGRRLWGRGAPVLRTGANIELIIVFQQQRPATRKNSSCHFNYNSIVFELELKWHERKSLVHSVALAVAAAVPIPQRKSDPGLTRE